MRRVTPLNRVRLLGVGAIVVALPYQSATPPGSLVSWWHANAPVLLVVFPLVTFLWLAVAGAFGYGSVHRQPWQDWPALPPFLLALAVRMGIAHHGLAELELHFFQGSFTDRHSIVHPPLQMFLQGLAGDPFPFIFGINGFLGALATLPLYHFVHQRTGDSLIGALVALSFALHPILVRMAPTDGPYSLITFTWFLGLALLSVEEIRAAQLFGGAGLLGIAATCRGEGPLFLLASLLLLDVQALLSAVRRQPAAAAAAACLVLGLVTAQAYFTFSVHLLPGQTLPDIGSPSLAQVLRAGLWSVAFNDMIFAVIVAVGAVAGIVDRRLRLGFAAALAATLVAWPISSMQTPAYIVVHRFVPVCSLQTIAAGVGLAWIWMGVRTTLCTSWASSAVIIVLVALPFARQIRQVRDANAVTEEATMLRRHLAPGGAVRRECSLLAFGRSMDIDICNLGHVLPGVNVVHCESTDCLAVAAKGGCVFYLRSLACFYAEAGVPDPCREDGRTGSGERLPCLDSACADLERGLQLSLIEERSVDMQEIFYGNPISWPKRADIGLFRVGGRTP